MGDFSRLYHTAQLRHAYKQLMEEAVKDQKQFAEGLIAPAIRHLEQDNQSKSNGCFLFVYLTSVLLVLLAAGGFYLATQSDDDYQLPKQQIQRK
jgi:hypothetical protein